MCGNAEQVDVPGVDVDGKAASSLGSVRVQVRADGAAAGGYVGEWLHDADLVVDRHHRDDQGVVVYRTFERGQIDETIRIHGEHDDFVARGRQIPNRLEDRRMFRCKRHDPGALGIVRMAGYAAQGEVARFGRTGCENDLVVVCVDEIRDLGPRFPDRSRSIPPEAVIARMRVAEMLSEVRPHCVPDRRIKGGCGLIVEVDGCRGHSVQVARQNGLSEAAEIGTVANVAVRETIVAEKADVLDVGANRASFGFQIAPVGSLEPVPPRQVARSLGERAELVVDNTKLRVLCHVGVYVPEVYGTFQEAVDAVGKAGVLR